MDSTSKCKVNTILKIVIQLLLLGLFLYIFGVPAVTKFLDKKVLVVKSRQNSKGTPAPAVTIIAHNKETQSGWKERGQLGKKTLHTFMQVGYIQSTIMSS